MRGEVIPEGMVDCTRVRMPGMSSENYVESIMAENLRFLGEGSSAKVSRDLGEAEA